MRTVNTKTEHIVVVAMTEAATPNVRCEECHLPIRAGDRNTLVVSKSGILSFYHTRCAQIVGS